MIPFGVELQDVKVRYRGVTAVRGVTVEIAPGGITGLLGRNGSGKSSLLSVIAGFRRPSSGAVRVAGQDPYENPRVGAGICLIREHGDLGHDRVREVLALGAIARETWSGDVAERLLQAFDLPRNRSVDSLSRGQRSALGAVVGLASRAPLTLLDEVYLGMDAPTRYAFYDALLADYAEHPRTIVMSSHLIEEVERLFEHVLMLHEGRLLAQGDADDLRATGVTVVGRAEAVERFVAPHPVLSRRSLGRTLAATIRAELTPRDRQTAAVEGLELQPVSLQDLFVHLTETHAHPTERQRTSAATGTRP